MLKINSLIILLSLSLATAVKYDTVFKTEKRVIPRTIINDIPAMTLGFFSLKDSLMITQDMRAEQDFLKIIGYKKNDLFIEFGTRGRGPDELPTPKLTGLSEDGEEFMLFDPNLKKIHYCEINSFSSKPNKVIDLRDSNLQFIFDARPVNENFIISSGLYKDGLFASIDIQNGYEVNYYGSFPVSPRGIDPYLLSELNKGGIRLSPSKEYIIFSTINFGYISCFKIGRNKLEKIWEHWITAPKYEIKNGRVYLKGDNILGFMDVAVTDEYVYAIYHGKEMSAIRSQKAEDNPETIMKFSLDKGTPLVKYFTDLPVTRIAINPEGKLYCIAKPLGYDLVEIDEKH
ncbi:MAG TPA: hypothetical protein ENN90_06620 [Mariniphaga anaerophila]|uniref:TolB-like 6-blade propeller-like n=1 Tax=Mariniphaga anaerophila TaxID=1484053 RepID=A0A831PQ35_9BACT|nr:hypothetical protein [Mariniphaga anaerophila]